MRDDVTFSLAGRIHTESQNVPCISVNWRVSTKFHHIPWNVEMVLFCLVSLWLWCDIHNRSILCICSFSSGLYHRHCSNRMIIPVQVRSSWRIWAKSIVTQNGKTTKLELCGYFMGHTSCIITYIIKSMGKNMVTSPLSGLGKTWASCQIRKIVGCAYAGNAGIVSPATAG